MQNNETITLYRKDNNGKIQFWSVDHFMDKSSVVIKYGFLNGGFRQLIVPTKEVPNRILQKRKKGYLSLDEVKDDQGSSPVEVGNMESYLSAYLPKFLSSVDGEYLPMLAKAVNDKTFAKINAYGGQWKINGLRCFLTIQRLNNALFDAYMVTFRSREGKEFVHLGNLKNRLLAFLDHKTIDYIVDNNIVLDGELYIPGLTIEAINSAVKNENNPFNSKVQFWCYDLAIEDDIFSSRDEIRDNVFYKYNKYFLNKETHLNVTDSFVNVPTIYVNDNEEAVIIRDGFIDLGFEGLVLKDYNSEYQFGRRNSAMWKYKRSTDGKFKIVDIYPEGSKRANLPIILCQNDVNDEKFETRVCGNHQYQEEVLTNKDKYIGKYLFVEFGERSGVKQVPFHIKNTYIIN